METRHWERGRWRQVDLDFWKQLLFPVTVPVPKKRKGIPTCTPFCKRTMESYVLRDGNNVGAELASLCLSLNGWGYSGVRMLSWLAPQGQEKTWRLGLWFVWQHAFSSVYKWSVSQDGIRFWIRKQGTRIPPNDVSHLVSPNAQEMITANQDKVPKWIVVPKANPVSCCGASCFSVSPAACPLRNGFCFSPRESGNPMGNNLLYLMHVAHLPLLVKKHTTLACNWNQAESSRS